MLRKVCHNKVLYNTMKNFDAKRYIGVWHEIALIPKVYESDCDSALAIYSLNDDILNIENLCLYEGNIIDNVQGFGIVQTEYQCNSKLLIEFEVNGEKTFGTYWVYLTDYNMFSIVSNEEHNSLWILSRNQTISGDYKVQLSEYCKLMGLDTNDLV